MKLYFQETNTPQGRATSDIEITKDGRKWLYFTAKENHCKYRMNKETGEIQISPYWRTVKDMYLK